MSRRRSWRQRRLIGRPPSSRPGSSRPRSARRGHPEPIRIEERACSEFARPLTSPQRDIGGESWGRFKIRVKLGHKPIRAGFKAAVRKGLPCWTRGRSHYVIETTQFACHQRRTLCRTPRPTAYASIRGSAASTSVVHELEEAEVVRQLVLREAPVRAAQRCRRELCWNCLDAVSGEVMVIGSGSEVNHCLLCRFLGQALPAVDLAHGDLA